MANRPTPGSPSEASEASAATDPATKPQAKPKRKLSEAQLAVLRANAIKPGEVRNPEGKTRPTDPYKQAAQAFLSILGETAPGQDRTNLQRLIDKILSSDHLTEVYLSKYLPTLTPQQINNFLTMITAGGLPAGGEAPAGLMGNRADRIRALAASATVEDATPVVVRPANGHTTPDSEPELEG